VGQRNVFTLAKNKDTEWEVNCVLFDDVELPFLITEVAEARSLGGQDDRTRGLAAVQSQQQKSSSTPVKTPSIQGFGSDPEPAGLVVDSPSQGPVQATADCEQLFSSNAELFFSECCMRTGAAESDPRCVLKTLMQVMENQQKTAKAPTTTFRTTTKKISDGFGVTESDVFEEEELDASNTTTVEAVPAEEFFSPSESEKVVWTLTGQISTWRGKYFTVLGFFLVFLVLFLLIIAALIYKLRAAKDASPPSSPGASHGCGGPSPGDDRAPLTPATQQAQTFQY